jgi:hypothetical protein
VRLTPVSRETLAGQDNDQMNPLPLDPTDGDILALIERWVRDLAAGDYEAAFSRTQQDPYYQWTAELIRETIQGYGLPEAHPSGPFTVSDPQTATGTGEFSVIRHDAPNGVAALVRYRLPLNGAWSDLTSTFRLERKGTHSVLILEELHVF